MGKPIDEDWSPSELRELSRILMNRNEQVASIALMFAANNIERLTAENKTLRNVAIVLEAERDALRAENERLRWMRW